MHSPEPLLHDWPYDHASAGEIVTSQPRVTEMPERTVYAIATIAAAGVAAMFLPWWGPTIIVIFGVLLTINPKWGGDDWRPF